MAVPESLNGGKPIRESRDPGMPLFIAHFVISVSEETGVVALIGPETGGLLSPVSLLCTIILGGNTVVLLASVSKPLSAITFCEVLTAGDVPAGVVNILAGFRVELLGQIDGHMDVNTIVCAAESKKDRTLIQQQASLNLKRAIFTRTGFWTSDPNL